MTTRIIKFKREDLYNKVWKTPLTKLAEEYGVSGNGLKKACIKMNIPVLYNGYWRKLETAKDVFKPPLPLVKPSETEIYEMKIEKKEENVLLERYRRLIAQEENPAYKVVVKNRYVRDHPLVSKTRQLLSLERVDSDGMLRIIMKDALNIAVTPRNLSRALRIMNALISELEKRNFVVKTKMGYHRLPQIILIFDGQEIEINMREVMKITKVKKEHSGSFNKVTEYERTLVPTGTLRLEIKNYWDNGTTRIVKDTKKQKLEDQLNLFIICIYRVINYDINRHKKWEEENRIQAEKEKARNLILKQKRLEKEKTEHLFLMAKRWHKTELVRSFITKFEKKLIKENNLTDEKKDWIKWAKEKADVLDPLNNNKLLH